MAMNILLIAAAGLAIWGFAVGSRKKDQRNTLFILAGIAAVAALVFGLGGDVETPELNLGGDSAADAAPLSCSGVDSVGITVNDKNVEKPGTNPAATSIYVTEGTLTGNQSIGTAIEFGGQSSAKGLAGYGDTSYYARPVSFDVGCSDMEVVALLAQSSALTATADNDDDSDNGASTQQTVDADDEREVEVTIDARVDRYWGAIDENGNGLDCNVVVTSYDGTYFDSIEVAGASKTAVPSAYSAVNTSYDEREAYEIGSLVDGEKTDLTLVLDSTSTNPDASTGHPQLQFYDCNYDIDQDDESIIAGVEDEDNNVLFQQAANLTIFVS